VSKLKKKKTNTRNIKEVKAEVVVGVKIEEKIKMTNIKKIIDRIVEKIKIIKTYSNIFQINHQIMKKKKNKEKKKEYNNKKKKN